MRTARIVVLAFVLAITAACGDRSLPTAPTPVIPECERNNTGILRIRNGGFGGNYTVDVVFNNLSIATLKPNEETTRAVTAGVAYPMRFVLTNSSRVLSSGQSPIVNRCATQGIVVG